MIDQTGGKIDIQWGRMRRISFSYYNPPVYFPGSFQTRIIYHLKGSRIIGVKSDLIDTLDFFAAIFVGDRNCIIVEFVSALIFDPVIG